MTREVKTRKSKPTQKGEKFIVKFGYWKETHGNEYLYHDGWFSVTRPQAVTAKRGSNVRMIWIKKLEEEDAWNIIYKGPGGKIPLTKGQYIAGCNRIQNKGAVSTITWTL